MTTDQVSQSLMTEQAKTLTKGKTKPVPITILTMGGSMMGGLAVSNWWFRGMLPDGGIWVSEKKLSKKGYYLERMAARSERIILRGHDRAFSEIDVARHAVVSNPDAGVRCFSCVMDGTSRIASVDGKQAMLDYIADNVLAYTYKGSPVFFVDIQAADKTEERPKHECSADLLAALSKVGRLWQLEAPAPVAPDRKTLLTPVMLQKLRDNKTDTPLYKLFGGGACTWLCVSLDEDGDTLWGWADLGAGIVEYGPFSLREIEETRFKPLNLHAERDLHFDGKLIDVSTLSGRTTIAGI